PSPHAASLRCARSASSVDTYGPTSTWYRPSSGRTRTRIGRPDASRIAANVAALASVGNEPAETLKLPPVSTAVARLEGPYFVSTTSPAITTAAATPSQNSFRH